MELPSQMYWNNTHIREKDFQREECVVFVVVYRRERDKRERGVLLRVCVFRSNVRERRKEEAREGSPRFGLLSVPLGIGIISLSLSP